MAVSQYSVLCLYLQTCNVDTENGTMLVALPIISVNTQVYIIYEMINFPSQTSAKDKDNRCI